MEQSKDKIIFETERLIVYPYTPDDSENFFHLNGNEDIMRYIRPAQTKELATKFLEKIIVTYKEQPGLGRWGMIAKDDRRFVGSFAIIPIEDSERLQLGYALLKEEWGKGYASEAVKNGIVYAFRQLGLAEICGVTHPDNTASQKILLSNGFVFEKTFKDGERVLNLYTCKRPVLKPYC